VYQAEASAAVLRKQFRLPASRLGWLNVGATVFLLGATSLFADISSEMVSTTLPLYLLLTVRLSPMQLGIVDGIYQGAAVLIKVISGIAADRWRRPKEVAAAGYGLSAVCRLGFLAAGSSWTPIAGVILLDRLGKGIRTAPRDAMIAASSRAGHMATAFGVHRAMDTAGAMLGPLLAVAILSVVPQGYDAIFVVSFCVAVVGVAVIVLFVDNPGDRPVARSHEGVTAELLDTKSDVSLGRVCALLIHSEFRTVTIAGSALALVTVSDSLLYLALRERITIPNGIFPLLYVITALAFMTFAIPAGRLADRIGHGAVFVLGYVLLAGVYSMLLLPWMNYPLAVLMLTSLGAYYAATDGVLMALASRLLPADLRTTGLALLTTGTGSARLLASACYGTVWSWYGAERALMVFISGLVVVLWLARRTVLRIDTN
jgi:MFS family permease